MVSGGVIADFFQDAGEVADGDAFGQQVLEDALHLADGELGRDQFVDDRRVGLLEIVQQAPGRPAA